MKLRALTFILACSCGLPAMAAERPNVPLTRPNVVTREAPVVRDTTARPMPTFRVAPSDLPRGNIVRPDVGAVRPILPSDARPIMPMLPGRPNAGGPAVVLPRPLPRPIEGRPVVVPGRPAG